ncbi:MAG TPA: GTP cyclohydrolase MptA [Candidatus Eremiobacteraceae bacterium]|nr:GTP cyclohydrolase MptA [Candidatus Eremiobacteraceae bacterium]
MTQHTHNVAIAVGSNLGDRQGNIASALARLRAFVELTAVSSTYDAVPVGVGEQPEYLNLACVGTTTLSPHDLRDALEDVERCVGRRLNGRLGPRAIDLDLLLYDDLVLDGGDFSIPHPGMTERAYVLVPLAEIAPDLYHPIAAKRVADLAACVDAAGVTRRDGGLLGRLRKDVQESRPAVALALNRAGVTGVRTLVDLGEGHGRQRTTIAVFDIFADLDATHSGVHMSRFSQDLEDALTELSVDDAHGVDDLALALAERVVQSQRAERAEVFARAEVALPRVTPASGHSTTEFYTVVARAVAAPGHRRRLLGVEAEGITACPCAQSMVADEVRERLVRSGRSGDEIDELLRAMPVATHNQRGRGTLFVGAERTPEIASLVEIVEQSMSSETYDLLKRPDELFVVNKAHFAPRFVEDVVREMLRYAADAFADVGDDGFVSARQVNYESIHKHDAMAESCATFGELRRELAGAAGVRHTTLEEWLYPR